MLLCSHETPDYITISGQTITRNQIDLTNDVTGILPSVNLDSDTAHLSGTQTFSGTKTFSTTTKFNSNNNQISIIDSDDNQDFRVQVNNGSFSVRDHTNSQTIFQIDNSNR